MTSLHLDARIYGISGTLPGPIRGRALTLEDEDAVCKDARHVEQAASMLLGSISHEMRTPLTIVRGYAELLVERADVLSPSDVAQMSGEILSSSVTLTRLVDDLLGFCELDQEEFAIQRRWLQLSQLLDRSVRRYQVRAGGERIRSELSSGLEVHADQHRLEQVIGNLLANAVTYAANGPIVIRAGRENGAVRVAVADWGPGLTAEEASRVWERFYRGAAAATSRYRGIGLGLTTVKRLVELHGGQVGVESAPDEGSTFWFTMPSS
jgi:signal transduction histidine kinase